MLALRNAARRAASSSTATPLSRSLATHVETTAIPHSASHRVLVIGGGTAGQTVSHQLARTGLFSTGDIAIVDPSPSHAYQPAWTLVGGGLKDKADTLRPMSDVTGDDISLISNAVDSFEPEHNRVRLADGTHIGYEHLVVCPGLGINWGAIKGLEDALGEAKNVSSIYSYDTCSNLHPHISALRSGKAVFTQPAGVIKCAGAPQKVMWMALDHWKQAGLYTPGSSSNPVHITFATGMPSMFSVPKYSNALNELRKERGVEGLFGHNLVEVNGDRATFQAGESKVERSFDLLHVTPPMGALDFVKKSPLAEKGTGFVDVDPATTRHKRFSNVWSVGDASSLPTSKTAAAISAEAPVLVKNLSAVVEGREPSEAYDGYTSCPLITEYGKVMLAEFKYGLEPKESFSPLTGVDQTVPQRAFYHLKKDFFPFVYFNSMVKGTWQGPKGFILGNPKGYHTSARAGGPFAGQQRRSFSTSHVAQRNRPARRPRDVLSNDASALKARVDVGEVVTRRGFGATFYARPPPSAGSPESIVGSADASPILSSLASDVASQRSSTLPPALKPRRKPSTATLSEGQIKALKALRAQNPLSPRFSAAKLAKRFGVSQTFVQIVAPLGKEERKVKEEELERMEGKERWGLRKRIARAEREERRAMW